MFQNEHVEELRSVLDLPQLYQKPSLRTLRETLYLLAVKPRSFEGLAAPLVHPKGLSNYLTGIVGSRLSWIQDESEKEIIWELASQRLSERSGRSGMASMTRSFSIPAASGAFDIRLHEPSLTEDNLGLKTWSSSFTLATRLHLLKLPSDALEGTILELGAGTGLVGLAASAMLQREVILTDLSVIELNLSKNIEINAGTLQTHNGSARSGVLDWTNPGMLRMRSSEDTPGLQLQSNTAVTLPNIGATSVESCCSRVASAMIILAADPIYSPDHPKLLVGTILTWLCKHNQARVILAYPLREAYAPQISELRQSLQLGGLTPIEEGTELAMDDWAEEVEHSWSVWAWKKVK